MATTTPNFGWDIPQSTDLVKDGAIAIAALGNDIDTSMVDLKGGTTGQILSKASNTDMDFTWVAQDDSNAIQNAIVDAKGDIITATAADTPARLAVGANNYFLGAASAETTGLKWLGDWINWTPTLTNLTLGNGTVLANYIQIGKMVTFYFRFTLGSTSSVGTDPRFSLPVTANRTEGGFFNTKLTDSGVGDYVGSALLYNSDIYVRSMNVAATYPSAGNTSATVPFTWGTGDFMIVTGTYEAA